MAFNSKLRWTNPHTPPPPLPSHIVRTYIDSPSGPLELLVAVPSSTTSHAPPLFFQHGGFGSAAVWIPYLTYFSQNHGIPCYALSVRGHGQSWYPGFFRMYALTSKKTLAEDVAVAVRYVEKVERERRGQETNVVLVGHSSGGGLAQIMLSEGMVRARGLVLAGSVPHFGSKGVYWNWFKLDPWFPLRIYWHLFHPRSPLSSTKLVHRAFFCDAFPEPRVRKFETLMPAYESMSWPMGMWRPFVNVRSILQNIVGWGVGERVLVIGGGQDKLVDPKLLQEVTKQYREAVTELVDSKKIEAKVGQVWTQEESGKSKGDKGQGIDFEVVEGAGHHLQNDLQWEEGARRIFDFVEQL